MLLVAVDDTDSRTLGGCTTRLAAVIAAAFPECAPAGPPRLVRLNPCVPWKTRGNGAVVVPLEGPVDPEDALARAVAAVAPHARVEDAATSPAVAVATRPLDEAFYWRAVRRLVPVDAAREALAAAGALAWSGKPDGRGLVGCAGALAWPMTRATYELIAYRDPARVGTPRRLKAASVARMAREIPETFDSYDFVEDTVVMVPTSPCPVLFGIRATDPAVLPRALALVESEPVHDTTLFLTNQGSDDHLEDLPLAAVMPHGSARVTGTVATRPATVAGGHVFLHLEDAGARLRLAAYEPTKSFRRAVEALRPGDRVRACGSVMPGPDGALTLNLEKVEVLAASPTEPVKVGNPRCCGRAMRSAGRGAGYRCGACSARAPHAAARWEERPRAVAPGWVEVPACARRHLARPLRLG